MDQDKFQKATNALLEKLYKALLPMEQVNDPFFLSQVHDSNIGGDYILLDLGPIEGQYMI